ncbi:reverse transcriptase [Cucumis melo var. makuwa]|uniref:Reverse transcriptase n=1 Tax=Cucumis melo var. makuwa TaxID=1194695 RepID=A0A5A7SQ08_CUCMM|nr:reverse transcriptase [Cucumis melo var. makuwa]
MTKKSAMIEEIKAIKKNDTWKLSTFPNEKKAVGVKRVFKLKRNEKGEVERYKVRLVAKGYCNALKFKKKEKSEGKPKNPNKLSSPPPSPTTAVRHHPSRSSSLPCRPSSRATSSPVVPSSCQRLRLRRAAFLRSLSREHLYPRRRLPLRAARATGSQRVPQSSEPSLAAHELTQAVPASSRVEPPLTQPFEPPNLFLVIFHLFLVNWGLEPKNFPKPRINLELSSTLGLDCWGAWS